jgi:protein tyrosine phosphatase (PTP) superfamily phosphohydrolase (DUF442 family)
MTGYKALSSQSAVLFAEALRQCEGEVAGFWRPGTRAAVLWELAGKPE